ncbi:MAG: hypothetical protein A2Z20_07695 [Bdellovibrionales bacterium RBG_16_40_8]|nr:MAG: hypothetical protein A2Z20_07695 [Bdellovibrionales bacterium RBG_16_40_8]
MTFLKRLVILILLWAWALQVAANTKLIEMKHPLSHYEINKMTNILGGQIRLFDKFNSPYFKRLYIVNTKIPTAQILSQPLVKKVESADVIHPYSVKPSKEHSRLSNDPLLPYQWAVENTGQVIGQDIDDITLLRKIGTRDAAIDFTSNEDVDRRLKREVVVAVIDTGVDTFHPDLRESIYLNSSECINGELPLNPKEDKDNNGYKGDCKGWNFTGADTNNGSRVIDDVGHGTHVAGIIAARINNEVGIAGLANKIKILPLKVFRQEYENQRGSKNANAIGTTDRLAKAILYATQMRVDVINLSLGWPLALDKNYLHEAIRAAIDNNIVVVAAASNNNHSAPILPCALNGVICVGSIDNDGSVSAFSNFGMHVDVLAPGDNILSSFPTALEPRLFSVSGYDLKSGTSQSAPYVSALAAILKAAHPEFTTTDILNLIISSSRDLQVTSTKTFLAGMISFKNALSGAIKKKVLPVFKENDHLTFKMTDKTAIFNMQVLNPTRSVLSSIININSLSDHAVTVNLPLQVTLNPQQSKIFPIKINILDVTKSSDVFIDIKIDEIHYKQHLSISRELDNDSDIKIISAPNISKPDLLSLESQHFRPEMPMYFNVELNEEVGKINIFSVDANELQQLGSIIIPYLKFLLGFTLIDLDNDGILEYQAIAHIKNLDSENIEYYNFAYDLKPFAQQPHFILKVENVLQSQNELSYLYKNILGKKHAVPFFFAVGPIPVIDQPKDPFLPKIFEAANHLYYFAPSDSLTDKGEATLTTHIVDSPAFMKFWKKKLKLRSFADIRLLHIMPQTEDDLRKNQIRLIVSVGLDYQRTASLVIMTFDSDGKLNWQWSPLNTSGLVIDGYQLSRTINLQDLKNKETTLIGPQQSTMWDKLSLAADGTTSHLTRIQGEDISEDFKMYAGDYLDKDVRYSFIQTISEKLFSVENNGKVKNYTMPFYVSSFLPGNTFLERGYPIWFHAEKNLPALYIDAGQIFQKSAYLIIGDQTGITAPLYMNVNVPESCRALNPSLWGEIYNFTLLCEKDKKWELRLLPMQKLNY